MDADADCTRNLRAFLLAIRKAEGTDFDEGYRALFGSTKTHPRLFTSYADHPRIHTPFHQTDGHINYTSAAGAWQMLAGTWDRLKAKLDLPDFSPESQDKAAIELLKECGAFKEICAGRWQEATSKAAGTWASLPGGHYPQHARSWDFIRAAYVDAGGSFEAMA